MTLLLLMVGLGCIHRGSWSTADAQSAETQTVAAPILRMDREDPSTLPSEIGSVDSRPTTPASPGVLQIGAYVTNISDIDLLEDRFSIEMLIWSLWNGDQASDPSDSLIVLNGIYDNDIQRFDNVRSASQGDSTWALHRVRSGVVGY